MNAEPRKRAAYEPGGALLAPTRYDPGMRRPVTTIAGAVLVIARAAIGLVSVSLALIDGTLPAVDTTELPVGEARGVGVGLVGAVLVVQLILGILILTGHNLARVWVMLIATIDICVAFVSWIEHGGLLVRETAPYTLALDVLVLLALSSRSAAAYARRRERPASDGARA